MLKVDDSSHKDGGSSFKHTSDGDFGKGNDLKGSDNFKFKNNDDNNKLVIHDNNNDNDNDVGT